MHPLKLIALLSNLCLASVSASIITPALPLIAQSFHINQTSLSWVTSIFLLGYVLGQLFYGPVANRYGRLFALRFGLCVMAFGVVICILASAKLNFTWLLIGRLIGSLGAASGLPCTIMLINESLTQKQAAQALAFGPLFFTIGIGGAAFIGGIVTHNLSWQANFYLLLFHAIIMLSVSYLFEETLQTAQRLKLGAILTSYKAALAKPQLLIFAFCVGTMSSVSYGYAASAPIYAHHVLHLTPDQYGHWNLINMLGMGGSSFLSAALINRIGAKRLLQYGLLGMLPFASGLLLMEYHTPSSPLPFFLTTCGLYLVSGLLFSAGNTLATAKSEDKASAASMTSFINIGTALLAVMMVGYLPLPVLGAYNVVLFSFIAICLVATQAFWLRQANVLA